MYRSTAAFKSIVLPMTLVLVVLITAAGAYLLNRQLLIPDTGANAAPVAASSPKTIDLGAGYTLAMDGMQGKILAPAAIIKTGPKAIDLGAGYSLVLDGVHGKIVSPNTIIKYGPKTTDLGAGYTLVLNAMDGKVVPPARPDTSVKRTDLGAGFVLEETAFYARIIAPTTTLKAQAPAVKKMDLGGGYWLVTGPDGGQIVKEGSR